MARPSKLPEAPARISDNALIESGEQAAEFSSSPEWEWMQEQLDAEIEARQWEKLNLSSGQGDRLTSLCGEIELLQYVKTLPSRALNMAKGAKSREAARNA